MLLMLKGQVTATSMARPRPCLQFGIVTSPGRRPGLSESLLLHHGRQRSLCANLVQQVANSVVTNNEVTVLCAARGVVAQNIEFLHPHTHTQNRNTQSNK